MQVGKTPTIPFAIVTVFLVSDLCWILRRPPTSMLRATGRYWGISDKRRKGKWEASRTLVGRSFARFAPRGRIEGSGEVNRSKDTLRSHERERGSHRVRRKGGEQHQLGGPSLIGTCGRGRGAQGDVSSSQCGGQHYNAKHSTKKWRLTVVANSAEVDWRLRKNPPRNSTGGGVAQGVSEWEESNGGG